MSREAIPSAENNGKPLGGRDSALNPELFLTYTCENLVAVAHDEVASSRVILTLDTVTLTFDLSASMHRRVLWPR